GVGRVGAVAVRPPVAARLQRAFFSIGTLLTCRHDVRRVTLMSRPLDGRTVALAEGRQLEELAGLLQQEGAAVLRCPMLSILDAPDAGAVDAWLDELIAGRFGLLVVMTGEAVRRL